MYLLVEAVPEQRLLNWAQNVPNTLALLFTDGFFELSSIAFCTLLALNNLSGLQISFAQFFEGRVFF